VRTRNAVLLLALLVAGCPAGTIHSSDDVDPTHDGDHRGLGLGTCGGELLPPRSRAPASATALEAPPPEAPSHDTPDGSPVPP
jgi:hypothetical protein